MGDAATFVNPHDAEAIAHNLKILLAFGPSPEVAEALETLSRFNWHQAAEKILNVADSVLDVV